MADQQRRAEEVPNVRDVLVAWFLHEWWEDEDVPAAELDADKVLKLLQGMSAADWMDLYQFEEVDMECSIHGRLGSIYPPYCNTFCLGAVRPFYAPRWDRA